MDGPDEICPRPGKSITLPTTPLAPPIYPTSVWICDNPDQADALLGGEAAGYVYQRDAHPNADLLAEKCRELHAAERAAVTASGMSALSAALLSQVQAGDHIVLSNRLYGRSQMLFTQETQRLGITSTVVDLSDPRATESALTKKGTKLVVVETIDNPRLFVADIAALAERVHRIGAQLLVDNTFATPMLCRPLEWGADLVMESITKMMNGHSDVILGLLCGSPSNWTRVPLVVSAWGLTSSPFDCWLAVRGLATLHLRMERACANALAVAEFLVSRPEVASVDYPGLSSHPQHALSVRQLSGRFGSIVTFHLRGGRIAATQLIAAAQATIPFCPSLGEVSTTLSHPESTSHRGLSGEARASLGITGGTLRLSCGVESASAIIDALGDGLRLLT